MELKALELPGAYVLKPKRFSDARGFFFEQHNKKTWAAHGLHFDFVQDNISLSAHAGTIRGLHFQAPPSAQAKLISVLVGALLDVIVDIRHGSPTYGRHAAVELSAENGKQCLVPRGFAHGFCTLTDNVLMQYKVDAFYDSARDQGLLWNDPDLGIRWPVAAEAAILVDRDKKHPRLRDLPRTFVWTGN
jgi:dTDP-4-dehydrorhamnose 3,5-epimerase